MNIKSRYLAALLGVVSALCADRVMAAPTVDFKAVRTEVVLSSTFLEAATALGLNVQPVRPGRISKAKARFPVIAAELDLANAKGEIQHSGGLRFSKNGTVVELTLFIIDTTGAPVLTGIVKANGSVVGRIPLFDLELPELALPIPQQSRLTVPGVAVKLSDEAATALNGAFSVSAFTEGLSIGTAKVILKR